MKNVYKLWAVLFTAMLLISAQGVEAQQGTPKTFKSNPHYNNGQQRDMRMEHGNGRNDGFQNGNGNYSNGHHGKDDMRIDPRGNGNNQYGFGHRQGHHFHGGNFYRFQHGQWARMTAPTGFMVNYLPYGTRVVYTRSGVYYQFGQIYFQKSYRGGGFVVVNAPRIRRGW